MERTLISWNFPNWVTVMIMAAAGYAILAALAQAFKGAGTTTTGATGGF
jgi:hypothetical protein